MSDPILPTSPRDPAPRRPAAAAIDVLDALLTSSAPAPLADGEFTARTLQALGRAGASAQPDAAWRQAATPETPLATARALVLEQRRYAAQARLWRWAMAGMIVGAVLLVVAVIGAPGDAAFLDIDLAVAPEPGQWAPLWIITITGALWFAWRQMRAP